MRRELNEIEYLHWCIGQPFNIVLAMQVRGDLSQDRLRAALDKAQRRHPLLGVNTEIDPRGRPWLSSDGSASTVDRPSDDAVEIIGSS